ncbi:MAG TPA: hypothetical protein VMW85_08440 [Methanomassiliicoccales archaeon]|nr:hypothetical protein [Methanomassiliicoccales archaeon]
MAVIDEPFELILESERVRLGKVDRPDGKVSIEVMVLLMRPSSSIEHSRLRRTADTVERLGGMGITMIFLEGGWAVGELTVPSGRSEESVSKIRDILSV